jgi:4-hydroxybenzoyl-CoA thioesterase
MTEQFERDWTVRFSDTDPFGIAHYPRIIDAIHETSDIFMERIGFSFWSITEQYGYGLPLVAMDFEFERPVSAGDTVQISLRPAVGTSSVEFHYEARHEGTVAFSGVETRVCAEEGGGSIEIPPDLREALAAYAEE